MTNDDQHEYRTWHQAWLDIWGKPRTEQCWRCGKWTSTNKGAVEEFAPDFLRGTVSDHSKKEIADTPYWRRHVWCPHCYAQFAEREPYIRVGTPEFTRLTPEATNE